VDLVERIIAVVAHHPGVRSIRPAGSRATGEAREDSDWGFLVEADDFASVAAALPQLLAPLGPLAQQWDRLSNEQCWMLILPGPIKVDLIFPDEPHEREPPWVPSANNLEAIDAHFWDWMLWLRGKEARGKRELVATELAKLFDHLLQPLGIERVPSSIEDAVTRYRRARDAVAEGLGQPFSRRLEAEVVPALVAYERGSAFKVEIKREDSQRYESIARQVRSDEIDRFVRESIRTLRERYTEPGRPFSLFMGCDKDDEQLVEVCLPTKEGSKTLPAGEIAFTIAQGAQCAYPEILGAYDAVSHYAATRGFSFGGPPREVYLNDLGTADPPEILIAFPLERLEKSEEADP